MARTGEQENKTANTQLEAAQTQSLNNANEDRNKYNAAVSNLEAAGNPYEDPKYLANESRVAATGSHAGQNAEKDLLDQETRRTGTNTAAAPWLRTMLGVNRERAGADALTGQYAEDQQNANAWKQWLTQAKLGAAGVDTSIYGTATGGRSSALGNLTQLGLASYGPWNAAIGAAGAVGAAALGKPPAAGCWIAEALYGVDDPRTLLMRFWLNNVWAKKSRLGSLVMKFYLRFGERIAEVVKRKVIVRRALRPVFDFGLSKAEAWQGNSN